MRAAAADVQLPAVDDDLPAEAVARHDDAPGHHARAVVLQAVLLVQDRLGLACGGGAVAVGQMLQGLVCRFLRGLVGRLQQLSQHRRCPAGHLQVAIGGRLLQGRNGRLALGCQLSTRRLALVEIRRVELLDQLLDRFAGGRGRSRPLAGCASFSLAARALAGAVSPAMTNRVSRAKEPTPTNRNPLPSDMIGILPRETVCGFGLDHSPKHSRYVTAKAEILLTKSENLLENRSVPSEWLTVVYHTGYFMRSLDRSH